MSVEKDPIIMEFRSVVRRCVIVLRERAEQDEGGAERCLLRNLRQKHPKLMASIENALDNGD